MIRQTFDNISNRISLALLSTVHLEDAWVRFEHDVPTELYGEGARHDFSWYLEGESETTVSSIEEISSWLSGCSYAEDPEFFHESDYWQHPCTFEKLRTGDCEDYALWIWRKLIQLGYETEFVAGRCLSCRDTGTSDWNSGHAWVQFVRDGSQYVFDALATTGVAVIRPIEDVRSLYLPEVSVDASLKRWVYGGYFLLRKGSIKG